MKKKKREEGFRIYWWGEDESGGVRERLVSNYLLCPKIYSRHNENVKCESGLMRGTEGGLFVCALLVK